MDAPRGQSGTIPEYFSAFGGLWPDRRDVDELLNAKYRRGDLTSVEVERVRHWADHGWSVIQSAINPEIVDAYSHQLDALLAAPSTLVKVMNGRTISVELFRPEELTLENSVRVLDHYVHSDTARDILLAPAIERFLTILFEERPLLFQSLGFEYGSQQGIHQDTAYVVVDSPLAMVGVWIALEDVAEGSGELQYYDRSHRLPEYRFGGKYKHWNSARDGQADHEEWSRLLRKHAHEMQLPLLTFRPRKGDVLVWHADLAHGGSPVHRPDASRRSLVGHYCPASATPHWFQFVPEYAVSAPHRGSFYCSQYYGVSKAVSNT